MEKAKKKTKKGKPGKGNPTKDKVSSPKRNKEKGNKKQKQPSKGTDGKKPKRQVVTKEHVYKLVKTYQIHCAAYAKAKGGEKNVSQQILGKVWEAVDEDYLHAYPESQSGSITLKDHLRTSLNELKSEVDNLEAVEKVVLQDEDLMSRLMETDSWKARNILKAQEEAVLGIRPNHGSTKTTAIDAGSEGPSLGVSNGNLPPSSPKNEQTASQKVGKPPTKSENLKAAQEDMLAILGEFKTLKKDRIEEAAEKLKQSLAKASFHKAKRLETKQRRIIQAKHNVLAEISLLEKQKELGLTDAEEFKVKASIVIGISK